MMDDLEWRYVGDNNLREGGHFWRNDFLSDDVAHVVQVHPLKDEGGPDNLFRLRVGLVHIPTDPGRRAAALSIIDVDPRDATRGCLVNAFLNHDGIDADEDYVIRIGPPDPYYSGRDTTEPDHVLRANTSLRKWLTRNYLHVEKASDYEPAAPGPR